MSKLVSIQYGLAKERHNYGEWRSLADLNFVYGNYSKQRVECYAPSIAVGNPKFENWAAYQQEEQRSITEIRAELNSNKPTVLFMPTWGELGSFDELLPNIANLRNEYNVIVKVHHNDGQEETKTWKEKATHLGIKHLYEGSADQLALLSVADVVVSDFSGAIFDAIYAQVPVVLYQEDVDSKIGTQKFDLSSLEFVERDTLGVVCESKEKLHKKVAWALNNKAILLKRCAQLRHELFLNNEATPAAVLIHEHSIRLLEGKIPALTPGQICVRETVKELRTLKRKKLAKKSKAPAGLSNTARRAPVLQSMGIGVTEMALSGRKKQKFITKPSQFFKDSKSPLIKWWGKSIGYPSE